MKRLPARKKLEDMHWQNAWTILDVEANNTRDAIAHEFLRSGQLGRWDRTLRRRLRNIYAVANDLGHYVGQPDHRPSRPISKDDERAHLNVDDIMEALMDSVIASSAQAPGTGA